MADDGEIANYVTALLLRYVRRTNALATNAPRVDRERDLDLLRAHWSVSEPIERLCGYLLAHPHEAQALLETRSRTSDAVVRGRLNARATVLERIRTANAALLVTDEPVRTFNTGPNRVLAWTLRRAARLAREYGGLSAPASEQGVRVALINAQLQRVLRFDAMRALVGAGPVASPSAGEVRDAARSRRVTYRLAVNAYRTLRRMEAGDEEAIRDALTGSLTGPIEDWRRFELAVALGVGEAIEAASGEAMRLHPIGAAKDEPIVTCGPFTVHWQQRTPLYSAPELEPSEAVLAELLATYGMAEGAERPDLVVVDRARERVAAIVEVKLLRGDTRDVRFREAMGQIVRYARGYATGAQYKALLARSLVALSDRGALPSGSSPQAPMCAGFDDLRDGRLREWAERLLA